MWPFFGSWRYELAKLDVTHLWKTPSKVPVSGEYCQGNRNRSCFVFALRLFKQNPAMSFDDLLLSLELFQREHSAPPLPKAENVGIIKGVLRNASRYGEIRINPNRGILKLPPKSGFLPDAEYKVWRSERHSVGAAYARQIRTQDRIEKVHAAIFRLQAEGQPITIDAVARSADVSWRTAKKYLSGAPGIL
jgi:hypothetical protein